MAAAIEQNRLISFNRRLFAKRAGDMTEPMCRLSQGGGHFYLPGQRLSLI